MGRQEFARWQDDSEWEEPGGDESASQAPERQGPTRGRRTDERVLKDILESLADNEAIRSGEIDIVVRDGDVTLTGTVVDLATRQTAGLCVSTVAGVRDVTNQLRIEFSPEVHDAERR